MVDRILPAAAALFGLLLFGVAQGAPFEARVSAVLSGDVIAVEADGETAELRLYGAHAPEQGQAFAARAKASLEELLLNETVTVNPLTEDNQERVVAAVTTADGEHVSHWLVREGLAWWDRENAPEDRVLRALSAEAIGGGVGLWAQDAPLAPWDYRLGAGREAVAYTVAEDAAPTQVAEADVEEEEEERPRELTLRGEEEYRGTYVVDVDPNQFRDHPDLNPAQLMMQHAPRIARDEQGQALGLTADNIAGIPFARQFGLRDGDIIRSVNGVQITSEASIPGLVQRFRNARSFNVEIVRGDRVENIQVNLP